MQARVFYMSLYEAALVHSAGVPIADVCDAVIASSVEEPVVQDFFGAMREDWHLGSEGEELRLVAPFKALATAYGDDYCLLPDYAKLAAWTTMIDLFWSEACAAYLLKQRLANHAIAPEDCVLGQQIMTNFPVSAKKQRPTLRRGRVMTRGAMPSAMAMKRLWILLHGQGGLQSRKRCRCGSGQCWSARVKMRVCWTVCMYLNGVGRFFVMRYKRDMPVWCGTVIA